MAAPAGIKDLGDLAKDIRKVEFKHTVVPSDESKVPDIFGKALKLPQRRKVYFYDTSELALSKTSGLILRARVTQGDDDDSTVKVRPADLSADAAWRAIAGVEVERDVSGEGPKDAAKLDRKAIKPGQIEAAESDPQLIGSLFTKEQEALIEAYAPGTRLTDLAVLGPVDARKWVFDDLDGVELCIEEWLLPDTTQFIELSTKVGRDEASQAQAAFLAVLKRFGVNVDEGQAQKTPRVLQFFASRLPAG